MVFWFGVLFCFVFLGSLLLLILVFCLVVFVGGGHGFWFVCFAGISGLTCM